MARVRAPGTGQAQVVATLRIHAARSCFIWSRARSTRSREEDTTNSVNRFEHAGHAGLEGHRLAPFLSGRRESVTCCSSVAGPWPASP